MRYQARPENVARFPIGLMCRCLTVSKAGFTAWRDRPLSTRAKANEKLLTFVTVTRAQSRQTTGSPRIHAALRAEGSMVFTKSLCCMATMGRP